MVENRVDDPVEAVINVIQGDESRIRQLEAVVDTLIKDNERLLDEKKDLIERALAHESIAPRKELQPTLIQLCHFYKKAVVEVVWPDGEIAICKDWWATEYMFWCTTTDNDQGWEIELDIEPTSKDCFKGKMIFRLVDPAEMPEFMKSEYYPLCKRIRFGQKTIYVDTPSSLLWAFNNCVDLFDLIQSGIAKPISETSVATAH